MFEIHPNILKILNKMQQKAPTYISGGYLRDSLIGIKPNDIDLLTEMTIEEVKEIFPQLNYTESGFEIGIGRIKYSGFEFEITSYSGEQLIDVVSKKDFTMNSLLHDGINLIDNFNALDDIKRKKIMSLHEPSKHFSKNPQAYLRAIRFTSQLDFELSENLYNFLKNNKSFYYENNESRIQQEGYKIARTPFPLKAIDYLNKLEFLNIDKPFNKTKEIPSLLDKPYMNFLLISEEIGLNPTFEFIDLFGISKQLKEKIHYLYPYIISDDIPNKPYVLNEVMILKKLQYKRNPELFKNFLLKIKNNR